ncbi:hypothetical protein RN001_009343 [Aquatica leii]|uniref:DUF4371 domain-containing protein n=1 Tax=Aquatica leii TaxID=1421715 RepID=A0AAN7P546_9COLE|nr:hypothetical protein RN001_009343 [Aquatica leii]
MDKKRKRLSGSQYKNRRLMKEAEGIKLSYALKEFLTQKSCQEDTSTSTARLDLLDEKETSINSQSLPEKILGESEPTMKPIHLNNRLKQKKTIDFEYQRILNMKIQRCRGVIKRIISIIRLLASQCLAFRGTTEHLFEQNNGNFLKLVELLSEFDPVTEEHIRRVQRESNKWSVTYLSNTIQDELINLMGNLILTKIVEIAKYFSIIADCTPDVSHVEQLSIVIKIVDFKHSQNIFEIEEFFIGLFEASDATGKGLTEHILTHLKKLESLECATEFPTESEVRPRRKKRLFDYEKSDDEPLSEETKFKINFFNYILDITINSLNERFTLLNTHSSHFQFLYDIFRIKDMNDNTLTNYCTSLQSVQLSMNQKQIQI